MFEHGTAMVDGPFYGAAGQREAEAVAREHFVADDGDTPYTVAEICPDHEEEPRGLCPECFREQQ
ncbi:hypothetical protein [Streptomyces sp. NPDC004267]|uniref:hypothetical protein n=1 Tax=Streptomyces sp. NPDC004267 TaxID=3364694 RepID=UPI00369AC24B